MMDSPVDLMYDGLTVLSGHFFFCLCLNLSLLVILGKRFIFKQFVFNIVTSNMS